MTDVPFFFFRFQSMSSLVSWGTRHSWVLQDSSVSRGWKWSHIVMVNDQTWRIVWLFHNMEPGTSTYSSAIASLVCPFFQIYRAVSIHKYNLEMSLNLTCVWVKHTVSLYYQLSTLVVTLVVWNKHLVCENHHVASSNHKFGASNLFLCFFVQVNLDVCC